MSIALSMLLVMLAAPAAPPEAAKEETFADALKAAKDTWATPEGKAYYDALASVTDQYEAAISACIEANKSADVASFQVVAKLDANGAVTKTLTQPETEVAACFAGNVKPIKYPKPPKANQWILIDMRRSDAQPGK
jgi:hypothetical protein